jgi:glycosyltransferase involved in cell wall biosynthesis
MRILVASDQWSPDVAGGSARIAAESARALAARGHEVTVIAPAAGNEGGLAVHRLQSTRVLPRSAADILGTRNAARRLGSGFDVVLAHQSTTACGVALAGRGAPLALVYHASAPREERFRRARSGAPGRVAGLVRSPLLEALERLAVRRARRILVLSEFSRGLLEVDRPEAAGRARLVGAGVDLDRFKPGSIPAARSRLGLAGDGPLLVTVRRLEPRMGVDVLLQALERLPGHRLAVVGSGPEEGRLRRLAESLGLRARVHFAGRAREEELPDWYRAADLFVLPTLAYEGFGVATAEALACGTPVVGTRVGATPELLGTLDARFLADGTDAAGLVAAIERVMPLTAEAGLRAKCRDYAANRFSWEQAVDSWEAALEEASALDAGRASPATAGARA